MPSLILLSAEWQPAGNIYLVGCLKCGTEFKAPSTHWTVTCPSCRASESIQVMREAYAARAKPLPPLPSNAHPESWVTNPFIHPELGLGTPKPSPPPVPRVQTKKAPRKAPKKPAKKGPLL
jgi:Zn ribbon nucleic-acid-binding protein